jgi:tRNA wybutosine-synthesizing protein 3
MMVAGGGRFAMVKARHTETFEKAACGGKADRQAISLCRFVAKTKNYFTSSSCAGRIILLELPKGGSKKDANFHRKWHCSTSFGKVKKALAENTRGVLWFKLDPFILHIGAKNIGGAAKILSAMKKAGVKRGGIIVAKEGKFLIELQGTESMALPVKKDSKMLVDESYLRFIVAEANRKLARNYKRLKKLEQEFRRALK